MPPAAEVPRPFAIAPEVAERLARLQAIVDSYEGLYNYFIARPLGPAFDDDEAARLSIGQMLRLRKHRVEGFSSAEAALAWPGLPEADCIICDIRMPGMDGMEATRRIRARDDHKANWPIIIVTADTSMDIRAKCMAQGADEVLMKPVAMQPLFKTMAAMVAARAKQRTKTA
jgi:CheY-like chemotaxis protein